MATTRIISMHINKGKTIAQCLKARLDYVKNPEKTEHGRLISAYACAPETADQEFLLNRNAYIAKTGRRIHNEVIAYQVRQSFQPGEVTPEEANKIGYELASRLLNGDFAFLVATHDDHAHIHNHIVFSAVSLDCNHKFKDVLRSGKVVAELSDSFCREHRLSIVENPQDKTVSYNERCLQRYAEGVPGCNEHQADEPSIGGKHQNGLRSAEKRQSCLLEGRTRLSDSQGLV